MYSILSFAFCGTHRREKKNFGKFKYQKVRIRELAAYSET